MELVKNLSESLASDLQTLLLKEGETALSESISSLQIVARCKCEDKKCSSFWTADISIIPTGTDRHRQISLLMDGKCYCLDIVDNKIVYVEVVHTDNELHDILLKKIKFVR